MCFTIFDGPKWANWYRLWPAKRTRFNPIGFLEALPSILEMNSSLGTTFVFGITNDVWRKYRVDYSPFVGVFLLLVGKVYLKKLYMSSFVKINKHVTSLCRFAYKVDANEAVSTCTQRVYATCTAKETYKKRRSKHNIGNIKFKREYYWYLTFLTSPKISLFPSFFYETHLDHSPLVVMFVHSNMFLRFSLLMTGLRRETSKQKLQKCQHELVRQVS